LASDLQAPPGNDKIIYRSLGSCGTKVFAAIKNESKESAPFFLAQKTYYNIVAKLSAVELLKNFTGCELDDETVIDHLRNVEYPYPYFRGPMEVLHICWTRDWLN
jgi:hypothetical protein